MADQLNVIKTMILNVEDKLAQQDVQYRRANRKLHGAVAELTESVQSCAALQQTGSFLTLFLLIKYRLISMNFLLSFNSICWLMNDKKTRTIFTSVVCLKSDRLKYNNLRKHFNN